MNTVDHNPFLHLADQDPPVGLRWNVLRKAVLHRYRYRLVVGGVLLGTSVATALSVLVNALLARGVPQLVSLALEDIDWTWDYFYDFSRMILQSIPVVPLLFLCTNLAVALYALYLMRNRAGSLLWS